MNIGLVVNARGKMCLVHDESFEGAPVFIGYHLDKKQLEIFLETGRAYPIDWEATDEMDNYLKKINKILMIRMEDKRPVEGYDTSLLHIVNGNPIELDGDKGTTVNTAVEPRSDTRRDAPGPGTAQHRTCGHPALAPVTLQAVTDASFEADVLRHAHPVLVFFWREWSGPASAALPMLEELSGAMAGRLRIVVVDAEQNAATAAKCDIGSIPAFVLYIAGSIAGIRNGALAKGALEAWIEEQL